MQKLINKILVPVDFSQKSKSAVAKAIEMAGLYDCTVHLLHIVKSLPGPGLAIFSSKLFISASGTDLKKELWLRLMDAYRPVQKKGGPSVDFEVDILAGRWEESLIAFVQEHDIDLVIIGENNACARKGKMHFDPDVISEKTNIPVITVPENKKITHLHSIVIPVTDFLPVRKLMYGIYLSSGSLSTIRLLGISNTETKSMVMHYLVKAAQLIREHCIVKVEMENVVSENISATIHQYAKSKAADMVILNPGVQSGVRSFFSALFSRKRQALPVMTIKQMSPAFR